MSQQSKLLSYYCNSSCSSSGTETRSSRSTPSMSSSGSDASTITSGQSESSPISSTETVRLPDFPVNPLDPATDVTRLTLSREYKRQLVQLGPCRPRLTSYPIYQHSGGQKRSFQAKWFDLPCSKEWLEYSSSNNKMYCFACRMFGLQCGEKREENWISVGVTGGNWKNGVKRIREHAATQYHMSSMVAFTSYLQNKPIDCLLDQQRLEEQSRERGR